MLNEVIVCSECGKKDCQVDELRKKEEISMEAYAERHSGYAAFPDDLFSTYVNSPKTVRRFLITCQDCGHQIEFMERMEPPQQGIFADERKIA